MEPVSECSGRLRAHGVCGLGPQTSLLGRVEFHSSEIGKKPRGDRGPRAGELVLHRQGGRTLQATGRWVSTCRIEGSQLEQEHSAKREGAGQEREAGAGKCAPHVPPKS